MKKLILFSLFIIYSCTAQNPVLVSGKIDSSIFNADQFVGRDQFGSVYYITNNVFTKQTGVVSQEYKNLAKGKIARADIQNPLLILLFYQSFNTVILLDGQLNEITQLTFNSIEFPLQAHAAGLASQNRIWLYDSLQQQILLYDFKQNTYRTLTTSFKGTIKYYESDYNHFYWIDENLNRYSCDVYGKITSLGKVPAFEQVRIVSNSGIIYQWDGNLYYFDSVSGKSEQLQIGEKSFRSFSYKDQILSIFTKEGITNYIIKIP